MDTPLRNTLRASVTACRRLLEEAVTDILQGRFGIFLDPKGKLVVEPLEQLGTLDPADRDYRDHVLAHLEHIQTRSFAPRDAFEQLVREVAFTHLNRLCAFKMMEARGLIREAVTRGPKSQGFFFYLADHPEEEERRAAGEEHLAYRCYLEWLASCYASEIRVLFSPEDLANRLFPPLKVLDQILERINAEPLAGVWEQDETLGWIYQYFTPKELRDQARKESAAPRNSYELAFRNQFYTPRYVVEFLTDNTLGRTWYEMRQGRTRLAEQCRYLVRRPNEVWLGPGEAPPAESQVVESGASLRREVPVLTAPADAGTRPSPAGQPAAKLDPGGAAGEGSLSPVTGAGLPSPPGGAGAKVAAGRAGGEGPG
jgi:hypothetical protein